jgi:hypothetical protein
MKFHRTIATAAFALMASVGAVSLSHAQCAPATCSRIGDVNGDGAPDVLDVTLVIGTAFRGQPKSHWLGSDDLNGDGISSDVIDVTMMINIAFRGGSQAFPYRVYRLTGRLGAGTWHLVDDDSLQNRIYGVFSVGTDDVNGSLDTVSVCPKTDTLIVCPGTVVQGDTSHAVPSAIVIRRTGYAQVVGTEAKPVVFTSMMPVGSRNRSDWGGFVINGAAPNNNRPTYVENTEGGLNVGIGGGNIPHDNSGCFVYLREEYSGREFSLDNELNGITVNSVGDGTTLDYVQVNASADDGIEWFGGRVNVKHFVVSNYDDDSFDSDVGAEWKGQFLIASIDENAGNSANHEGFEWDNHPDPATEYDNLPRMMPTVYNATLVGMGHNFVAVSNSGIHQRRGAALQIFNTVWTRFKAAIDFDNDPSCSRLIAADSIHIQKSVWYDVGKWADDGDSLGNQMRDNVALGNELYVNAPANPALAPILVAASFSDPGFPDYRPVSPSNPINLDTKVGVTPPNDGFFDPTATFLGAVKANDPTPWYAGWTQFAEH